MNENELIESAKNGNEISKNLIINNYEPLIISIINKKKYYINGGENQDLIQEGRLALFNAITTFEPEKNIKFSTFAHKIIDNQLKNTIKKFSNSKNSPLNSAIILNNQGEVDCVYENFAEHINIPIKNVRSLEDDYIDEHNAKLLIDNIVKNLSDLENKILQLKLKDYSYVEIAKILNISSKAVDNALNRIKNKITNLK